MGLNTAPKTAIAMLYCNSASSLASHALMTYLNTPYPLDLYPYPSIPRCDWAQALRGREVTSQPRLGCDSGWFAKAADHRLPSSTRELPVWVQDSKKSFTLRAYYSRIG